MALGFRLSGSMYSKGGAEHEAFRTQRPSSQPLLGRKSPAACGKDKAKEPLNLNLKPYKGLNIKP